MFEIMTAAPPVREPNALTPAKIGVITAKYLKSEVNNDKGSYAAT